jgi:hypothetical protein
VFDVRDVELREFVVMLFEAMRFVVDERVDVITVVEAYGKMEAILEVDVKKLAVSDPPKKPLPLTERFVKGDVVPTPTFPEKEVEVFGSNQYLAVVVEVLPIATMSEFMFE